MRKRSVAVMTMHYIDNYGSLAQTYATQVLFGRLGIETKIIDYVRPTNNIENLIFDVKRRIQAKGGIFANVFIAECLTKFWKLIFLQRRKVFDRFRQKYFHLTHEYTSADDLFREPPEADIYCTGSDQMWNTVYNGGVLPEYFMDFAPEGKPRIGLSVSIGQDVLNDNEKAEMLPLLKKYKCISVREQSAKQILADMGIESTCVLDPTLMLEGEFWRNQVCVDIKSKENPYVLLYQLNPNPSMTQFAKRLAKEKGINLEIIGGSVQMMLTVGHTLRCHSEEEWLSLLANADCVVTDSFHGTAFSVNFNRDVFIWYPPKYSTRLESFAKLLGIEHRIVESKNVDWRNIPFINYNKVNEVIEGQRVIFSQFLEKAVN